MALGSRVVALLVAGLALAGGAVVWISMGSVSQVTRAAPSTEPAPRPLVRATSRHRVRDEPPSAAPVAATNEPASPLDSVKPLPSDAAARSRADAGGSLSAAAARIVDPKWHWNESSDPLYAVYRGWGLDGTRRVFELAAERLGEAHDQRRTPVLFALADTEFRLGHVEKAADRLVDAVLAMDPDWPGDLHGMPRLVYFAGGPNVDVVTAEQLVRMRQQDARELRWLRSGAASFDGGSPLPWESSGSKGQAFFNWALTVTAAGERPEQAMAASIWVHAISSRNNWQKLPHGLPVAATFRTMESGLVALDDASDRDQWSRGFETRRTSARAAGEQWSGALDEFARRIGDVQRSESNDTNLDPVAIWSLSDEFARRFTAEELARRFPGTEFPRADVLRKLAARLVEFPPAPAAVAPK